MAYNNANQPDAFSAGYLRGYKSRMNYRKLNNLGNELYEFWKRLHGLYLDSVVGFCLVHQKISKDQSFILKCFPKIVSYNSKPF